MIVYSNNLWGLAILFRLYGSAFPRAVVFASISALMTAILYYYGPSPIIYSISNPFAYSMYGSLVSFAVVFRSNLAYQRYWEGRTTVQTIMGRLHVLTMKMMSLNKASLPESKMTQEDKVLFYNFHKTVTHKVSLLFGLMLCHLRGDFNLNNIVTYTGYEAAPILGADQAATAWLKLKTFFFELFPVDDYLGIELIHLDPHMHVIGGMSEEERQAFGHLQQALGDEQKNMLLEDTRVISVYSSFYTMMIDHFSLPCFDPKVVTSVLSTLNALDDVLGSFGQACKLATTPFPFPWAQVVTSFLVIMTITLPFVTVTFLKQSWIGVMMSFVTILTYWSLNEVANEMEDPFGYDPNDLPLSCFQYDLNKQLIASTWKFRPHYFDEIERDLYKTDLNGKDAFPVKSENVVIAVSD
mmetsp:Transcript_31456/g.57132  ORF Transcript_31456/g.57132 Transcript_31456/m.57132 type:complete len:411 (-) Transcript_31456:850-2082(-)